MGKWCESVRFECCERVGGSKSNFIERSAV